MEEVTMERLINGSAAPRLRLDRIEGQEMGCWQSISRVQARSFGGLAVFGQTRPHAISFFRTRNRLPSANSVKSWARFLASPL